MLRAAGTAVAAVIETPVGANAALDSSRRQVSKTTQDIPGERSRAMIVDSANDRDQVRSAVTFIAAQLGGPQRVLDHHQKMPSELCSACSSVRHVRWPCPIVGMALQAEVQQDHVLVRSAQNEASSPR